uniref:Tail protein n=1 Tax=viral metagenome TaxID=1070528 RepID=A0A6M3KPG7_9ZZZZ
MDMRNPSDLYDAIAARLQQEINGITTGGYESFGDELVGDAVVLIEFERSESAGRDNAGRIGHRLDITLHCVVGRHRHRTELEAVNLAAAVERLAHDCSWGLPREQIDWPKNIRSAPSMFKKGPGGFEAWGVSFSQTIYLGSRLMTGDTPVGAIWYAVTPPADANDPAQYQRFDHEGSD